MIGANAAMLAKCDLARLLAVRSRFPQSRPIELFTACSGAEVVVVAFERFAQAYEAQTGQPLDVVHVAACDISLECQGWSRAYFAPKSMFNTVEGLVAGELRWDLRNKRWVRVPSCDIFIAGTECDDWSSMNLNMQIWKRSMALGVGNSAVTAIACVGYIRSSRPRKGFFENLVQMGKYHVDAEIDDDDGGSDSSQESREREVNGNNLFTFVRLLETLNFVVEVCTLDPLDGHGYGQRPRHHIYFDDVVGEERASLLKTLTLRHNGSVNVGECMCSDADPLVDAWLDVYIRKAHPQRRKWENLHQKVLAKLGKQFPGFDLEIWLLSSIFVQFEQRHLDKLTARQVHLLKILIFISSPLKAGYYFWDLGQSLGRVPHTIGHLMCLMPNADIWAVLVGADGKLLAHGRLLVPVEVMKLQGFDPVDAGLDLSPVKPEQAVWGGTHWTWRDIMRLMGNSFNGHTTCVALQLLALRRDAQEF